MVMVGAGNVATSLARALAPHVVQVWSRDLTHALALADVVGCDATSDLATLRTDANVVIVSVHDDAAANVASAVPDNGALWLHTSGSVPIDALAHSHTRCGVLYPMQSFSKQTPVPLTDVPIFVEGCDEAALADAEEVARLISHKVYHADSARRKKLHLAAVFACNFANHMWTLSSDVLEREGIDFEVMKPLIRSTVAKLDSLSPQRSQTGPAARGDEKVIRAHLNMLSGDAKEVYRIVSQSIINTYNQ